MGSLVSGEVRPVGRAIGGIVSSFRVIPHGASYFVADKTFVVADVFRSLGGGEVDSVYIHGHRVP